MVSKESSMRCYLSAPWLVPGRAPSPWSLVTPQGCTRPWSYCCSLLSYLQSCQERQRQLRIEGGEGRGGGSRGRENRGRALPWFVFTPALWREIESKGILPHPSAQILLVNGDCHKFECRLKIFSRCLSVLDDNLMKRYITHSRCNTRGGVCRFHTDILLRFTSWRGLILHTIPPLPSWCITCSVSHMCSICVCLKQTKMVTGEEKRDIMENGCLLQYIRKHYGSGSRASVMKEQQQKTRTLAHMHTCTLAHLHTHTHTHTLAQ